MSAQIQPELWVSDGPAAVAFYERAFGAVVEHRVSGPGALDIVAQLAVGDARFWVSNASDAMGRFAPDAIGGATARMLLVVDEPEAVVAAAVAARGDEPGRRRARLAARPDRRPLRPRVGGRPPRMTFVMPDSGRATLVGNAPDA